MFRLGTMPDTNTGGTSVDSDPLIEDKFDSRGFALPRTTSSWNVA